MNKTNKKMLAYSAAAVAAIIAGRNASANIQYTDLDPDVNISASGYALDLDGGGQTDFTLQLVDFSNGAAAYTYFFNKDNFVPGPYNLSPASNTYTSYTTGAVMSTGTKIQWQGQKGFGKKGNFSPAAGNGLLIDTNVPYSVLGLSMYNNISDDGSFSGGFNLTAGWALSGGDVGGIGYNASSNTFMNMFSVSHQAFSTYNSFGGAAGGGMTKYIGLKFMLSGEMKYGWAEVTFGTGSNPSYTLNAFAYEDDSDFPIQAGMTIATGVEGARGTRADVYSFGKNIHVKTTKGVKIEIYNLAGQQVYTGVTKGSIDKIDMRDHDGMHVVKVGTTSKKVYIN